MVWKRRHGHRLWLAIERLDLPTMFRLRLVIPISVFALTAMVAILPSIASADGPAAAIIHDGGDPTTWGFTPVSTSVVAGQTVTWTNTGAFAHDAASTDGSWKTPLLNTGGSASVTFSSAGTFTYICTPHPWMIGTVVVTAAPPAVAPPSDATVIEAPPAAVKVDVPQPIAIAPTELQLVDDIVPPTDPASGN